MPINVYFAAGAGHWPEYRATLAQQFHKMGLDVVLSHLPDDPAAVDYIIFAPGGDIADFTPYTRCKAVLNLWAGVEKIVVNPSLTQPLCRMVDPALTAGMVEYVVGNTLRHHLGLDRYIGPRAPEWRQIMPPLARERRVVILGMGELGTACARALMALGFDVTGWSRGPKSVDGVRCVHGADGLQTALTGAEIVVTLLPKTPATDNTLNTDTLALLARGAFIINPGRGPLIDDQALLAALDSGQVAHATLDVFRVEPLPAEHPFWAHPGVTITPHIAADTRAATASEVVAENVRRGEAGLPFLHLVDRTRGY